jgi:hypothetical protein
MYRSVFFYCYEVPVTGCYVDHIIRGHVIGKSVEPVYRAAPKVQVLVFVPCKNIPVRNSHFHDTSRTVHQLLRHLLEKFRTPCAHRHYSSIIKEQYHIHVTRRYRDDPSLRFSRDNKIHGRLNRAPKVHISIVGDDRSPHSSCRQLYNFSATVYSHHPPQITWKLRLVMPGMAPAVELSLVIERDNKSHARYDVNDIGVLYFFWYLKYIFRNAFHLAVGFCSPHMQVTVVC